MAGLEIENQGRHDGEGFRELADDLWSNKPLLIVLAVGLFLVVYLIAKNRKSAISAPGSITPSNPAGSQGNYLAVFDVEPPNVNVTVNNPNSTQQQGGGTTTPPSGNPCRPGYHFVPGGNGTGKPTGILQSLIAFPTGGGSYPVTGGMCVPDSPTPTPVPIPTPTPPPPPPPPPPKGTPRTVTVTKWPSQDSTLWGIAQHYHVNEQALYNLNKAKIGNNPNLIHAGLVLTLPS